MESSVLSPLGDLDSSSGTSDTTGHTMSGYLGHHQGLYVNGSSKFNIRVRELLNYQNQRVSPQISS